MAFASNYLFALLCLDWQTCFATIDDGSDLVNRVLIPGGKIEELYDKYNEKPFLDHWMQYGRAYEKHLPRPETARTLGKQVKILEIGVQSGGSVRLWKQYYGDTLMYVGLDIDRRAKRSESLEENIHIELGSQADWTKLEEICDKYGPFDVIIDDGGHSYPMILTSLLFLYPKDKCMKTNSVYAIEDMHTLVTEHKMPSIFSNIFGAMMDYWCVKRQVKPDDCKFYDPAYKGFSGKVLGVHYYDSQGFIERGVQQKLQRFGRPKDSPKKSFFHFPYGGAGNVQIVNSPMPEPWSLDMSEGGMKCPECPQCKACDADSSDKKTGSCGTAAFVKVIKNPAMITLSFTAVLIQTPGYLHAAKTKILAAILFGGFLYVATEVILLVC